MFFEKLEVG